MTALLQRLRLPGDGATWRKYGVLMTLMMAHDLPNTLTGVMVPTVFTRRLDMPLEYLGLFTLPLLVTACKWTWAPLVDNHGSIRFGWRKSWLAPCALGVALCLAAVGLVRPSLEALALIVGLLMLKQLFYSTFEIAGDAYIVENLKPEERGLGSSLIWLGREFGQLIGFAGLLYVTDRFGWRPAFFCAAGLFLLFCLPVLLRREPARSADHRASVRPVTRLRAFFSRSTNWWVLAVVFCVSFTVQMPVAVIGPFLGSKGLSLSQIGIVIGISASLGAVLSLALAAPVIARIGPKRMAKVMLVVAPMALPGFLYLAHVEAVTTPVVMGIIFFSALCTAPIRMVVYAARIGWASEGQVGTDFTVQQSTWFLGFAAAGGASGLLAAQIGWFGFFLVNFVLTVLAIAFFILMHDPIEQRLKPASDVPKAR
ncbi:MAG: MFS transporter [Pseudomonadota bacterium]